MKPLPLATAPPPAPDLLVVQALPLRLQRMVALLLAHGEVICRYPVGNVELHFHGESVQAKLACNLVR